MALTKTVILLVAVVCRAAAYTEVTCSLEEEVACIVNGDMQKAGLENTCSYDLVQPPSLCGCWACPQGLGDQCDMDPAFYLHGSCGKNSKVQLKCEDRTVVAEGQLYDPRTAKGECVVDPCSPQDVKDCEAQAELKDLFQMICGHTLIQPPTACGCYVCPKGLGEACDVDPAAHKHGPCVEGLECVETGDKTLCSEKQPEGENTVRMLLKGLVKSRLNI